MICLRRNAVALRHRCVLAFATMCGIAVATASAEERASVPVLPARVSVDSTYPGYNTDVLTDGKWIEKGQEDTHDSSPNRFGNGGNTWVSADDAVEHWIRLDWAEPVTLDELVIWWSLADWYPRAFRVERLEGEQWVPVGPDEGWLATTDRQSVIPLPSVPVQSLRLLQPGAGGGTRALLAAQEIMACTRSGDPRPLCGVRRLSSFRYARLTPAPLARNIACLDKDCPGAAAPLLWSANEEATRLAALADGDTERVAATMAGGMAVGIRWPISHVMEGAAVVIAGGELPDAEALQVEIHDGRRWVPITRGMTCRTSSEHRRIEWAFESLSTRSIRIRAPGGRRSLEVAEAEVYRYLPARKTVWPERFTAKVGLKQTILAAPDEPSFESVALNALPMRTARALLGLKDAQREVGVGWEGTIEGQGRLELRIGLEQYRLADFADTVRRELIDGWRPGVIVEGRMQDLKIRETAFVAPMDATDNAGVLLVELVIRNLSNQPRKTFLEAELFSEQPGSVEFKDGLLVRSGQIALISTAASCPVGAANAMRVDVELAPGEAQRVLFVEPQGPVAADAVIEPYRSISFDDALLRFRRYWDDVLATTTSFEVPEPRVNRTVKAVLAQCFINGDGDVMPYGSAPSVYEGSLFGIEESYPMLALAMFGFGPDTQRYLDGTYLTPAFLHKVDEYETLDDRHQQYRNGLQPHYAVSAYRLTRDAAWIRKHLPLLKTCAEWTMAQRRKTMVLEDGRRPLHWGLLPKWSYGGDIFDVQCYTFFANLCCWRGLVDTAWLLGELGEHEAAKRYADEARDYREAIDRAMDGSYQADKEPPFLPLRLYATQPDEQLDYYQLFAGCLLDLEALPIGSKHSRWITEYLEADNRIFCLLPRFRHMGSGALDAIYGKGYVLTKLHEDSVREFLLAFYMYLAVNMERDVFTSRETNVLYTSDLHVRSTYGVAELSDPLPSGSAVALHLIRHMLVTEARVGAGEFSGDLLLLAGTPRAWFADGQAIRIRNAPTYFGAVGLDVRSRVAQGRIEARVTPPARNPRGTIRLRLRHPEGKPVRSVTVNGEPHTRFDAASEWIALPPEREGDVDVVAYYTE